MVWFGSMGTSFQEAPPTEVNTRALKPLRINGTGVSAHRLASGVEPGNQGNFSLEHHGIEGTEEREAARVSLGNYLMGGDSAGGYLGGIGRQPHRTRGQCSGGGGYLEKDLFPSNPVFRGVHAESSIRGTVDKHYPTVLIRGDGGTHGRGGGATGIG